MRGTSTRFTFWFDSYMKTSTPAGILLLLMTHNSLSINCFLLETYILDLNNIAHKSNTKSIKLYKSLNRKHEKNRFNLKFRLQNCLSMHCFSFFLWGKYSHWHPCSLNSLEINCIMNFLSTDHICYPSFYQDHSVICLFLRMQCYAYLNPAHTDRYISQQFNTKILVVHWQMFHYIFKECTIIVLIYVTQTQESHRYGFRCQTYDFFEMGSQELSKKESTNLD